MSNNFVDRRLGHGARGMCEMTSVPYSRMDFHRDFVSDPQCDYYERDPNCVINKPGIRPSYWNQPSRPSQSYGPPYGSPHERPDTKYAIIKNLLDNNKTILYCYIKIERYKHL